MTVHTVCCTAFLAGCPALSALLIPLPLPLYDSADTVGHPTWRTPRP